MKNGKIIIFFALLFGVFFQTSCLERTFEEVKEMPKIENKKERNFLTKMDVGRHFSQQKSFNWKPTKVPTDIKIILLDSIYKPVDYFFFLKFNKWFEELKFNNGILPIDKAESLDCDNFAMLYKSLFGIASYNSDSDVEFAVAVAVVEQRNEFGGVPKGYLHMINLVFCNNGWYMFEPQTGDFINLDEYPNQEYIKYIIL